MRAVLRRIPQTESSTTIFKVRELEIIPNEMVVKLKGQPIYLSKTEYLMLKTLVENPNKVFSRRNLIEVIWGKDYFIDENTIDVYIGYLRSKIDNIVKEEYIKTIRGVGYKLVSE